MQQILAQLSGGGRAMRSRLGVFCFAAIGVAILPAMAQAGAVSDPQGVPQPAPPILGQPLPLATPTRGAATASPQLPPTIGGSFPRSFVIPGTETSVTISGSVQSNFGFGSSR